MTSTYVKIVNKLPAADCKQVGALVRAAQAACQTTSGANSAETQRAHAVALQDLEQALADFMSSRGARGLVATLRRVRIEVPAPRHGRPGYRWAQGYVVRIGNGPEMFPPVLRAEAYRMAREAGATSVSIIG